MEQTDKIFIKMVENDIKTSKRLFEKAKKENKLFRMAELEAYIDGMSQALAFFKQVKDIDGVIESIPLPEEKSNKGMKKGKYYIGDFCYIFGDSWQEILDTTGYLTDGYCKINGYKCFAASTAYGDGEYKDNEGFKYPVDAGLIGIAPVKLLKLDNKLTEEIITEEHYGRIVEMKEDFDCVCENGIFQFGDITINTRDCEEEEE
jgi:hypothetical protein